MLKEAILNMDTMDDMERLFWKQNNYLCQYLQTLRDNGVFFSPHQSIQGDSKNKKKSKKDRVFQTEGAEVLLGGFLRGWTARSTEIKFTWKTTCIYASASLIKRADVIYNSLQQFQKFLVFRF